MENFAQHITRTRIAIPRKRADLISRQRLLNALDELLDKKIIIIAAPAGYGKTSLLIDLADDLALPVCWYSLDALDQNISRFLAYFVASIQIKFPDFKTNIINVLHSSYQKEVDVDAMVTMLVNDIYDQITEHFIIMLDDYHLVVEDTQINQFLSRFLQNVEENCHIVFASRTLLALPDLPLMVARGLVGGLGFEELAFTTGETRELFFNNHHIVLSDTEAETLCKQTEGWITGLLLTAQTSITRLHAQEKNLRATGININDYFELIYNVQPEHIRQFLLYTSLLEDFDFDTVNQTVAKIFPKLGKQYKACADHIFKANLFVQSVGLDGLSLRYHHLFLDYLQQKIRLEQAETYEKLQDIIASHYRETKQWEKAYEIYRKEGLLKKQIALLEEAGVSMMYAGQASIIKHWLSNIPDEKILDNPALSSLMGTVLCNSDNIQNGLTYFANSIEKTDKEKQIGLLARTQIRMAVAYKSIGHFDKAVDIVEEALNVIKNKLSLREIRAEAYRILGTCYSEMGNPVDAQKYFELAYNDFSFLQNNDELALISFNLGTNHLILSEYIPAKKYFLQNIEYWEKTGNNVWLATVLNNMGVLQHSNGEIEDAVMNLEKSLHYSRLTNNKRLEAIVLTGIGDIYTDLEAYDEASLLYFQSIDISQKIKSKYVMIYAYNAIALVAIFQNNFEKANFNLREAKNLADELNSDYETNLIEFTEGINKYYQGEFQEAIKFFATTSHFFASSQYKVLLAKNYLYSMLIYKQLQNNTELNNCAKLLENLLTNPENQFVLFPIGIKEKKSLSHIAKLSKTTAYLNPWLEAADAFKKRLPIFRRNIRRKTTLIPFAPANIEIISLGETKVKLNNKTLSTSDWQTQSARDLFLLLLSKPQGLSKEEIGLLLWPEDSEQELKFHFKNAIYRVRHAIGKECIILDGDHYYFNKNMDYHFDVIDFQREISIIKKSSDWDEQYQHYKKAVTLYKGPYLSDINSIWIQKERNALHEKYINLLKDMSEIAFNAENFKQAIEISQEILQNDQCNEDAYRIAMRSQAAIGNRNEVDQLYKLCEKHLLDELEAPPSQQTKKLHQTLMKI